MTVVPFAQPSTPKQFSSQQRDSPDRSSCSIKSAAKQHNPKLGVMYANDDRRPQACACVRASELHPLLLPVLVVDGLARLGSRRLRRRQLRLCSMVGMQVRLAHCGKQAVCYGPLYTSPVQHGKVHGAG